MAFSKGVLRGSLAGGALGALLHLDANAMKSLVRAVEHTPGGLRSHVHNEAALAVPSIEGWVGAECRLAPCQTPAA